MDLLNQYYEDIAEHYELQAERARKRKGNASNPSKDDRGAIEKAKSLFGDGYRFRVDFNLVYSIEMVKDPITLLGFKARKPGEDEEHFEMEILWLGDICSLRAGDVSRVLAEEFSMRLAGEHPYESDRAVSPPDWLRSLTREIIRGEDGDEFSQNFANSVLFFLHVLTKHSD